MYDPDLLQAFVRVAETGGFTRAAERLHSTQTTISSQIKRLEGQIGRPLLRRTTRQVTLTHDGEIFLGYARRILRLQNEAKRYFDGQIGPVETIRLGVTEDFASGSLALVLARFRDQVGAVRIEVEVGLTRDLLQTLEDGSLDFVLGKQCTPSQTGDLLWTEPLVWAFTRDCDLGDLDPLPLALFQAPCVFRDAAVDALLAARLRYDVVFVSRSFAGLKAAAASGLAITVLPQSMVGAEYRTIRAVDGLPPLPDARFMMYRRMDESASPIANRLAEQLVAMGRLR